jgi:transcriptional regulator with XRE-family HTH domain
MLFIRQRRLNKKLSQAELAKKATVPQSVIAEIETGKSKNPTVETAIRIANVLDCTVEDLTVAEEKAV